MSNFSFTQPSFVGFGSTGQTNTAPSTGFSFGQPAAAAAPAFGQTTSTAPAFGQNTGAAPSFGQPTGTASTFGQPASAAPTFGQPTSAATSFGAFGSTATSAAPSTGFSFGGATSAPSAFGQPAAAPAATSIFGGGFGSTAAPSTGFSFGQPTTSTAPAFSGFGSTLGTTTAPASTGFSFGQPTTSAPTFSGFGTSAAPSSGFSFAGPTTTPAGTFGGFGSSFAAPAGQTSSLFGQPQQQQQSLLFGGQQFGQQQQQQQQQQPQQAQIDENQALYQSVFQVSKFGDERDTCLARLNYLQACWGCGKGYYSQAFPPVTYTQSNPFYRFKAVGYAYIFTDNNEDGNVMLIVKKPQTKLEAEETQLIAALQTMIARPHILFKITGLKPNGEDVTQVVLHAEDKSTLRRIPATDLVNFFSQQHLKPQLERLAITGMSAKVRPSPEQLKRYLDSPPEGIDPRVWRKAQEDNPDPSSMIPVPILGIEALKSRIHWQQSETHQHHVRLGMISDEVTNLHNRHSNITAELQQLRRKHGELSHRVLSVIVRQEMTRKQGMTIQAEEEQLKEQLEKIDEELNSPTQFKGRLNELLSQIRLRKSENETRGTTRYSIDPTALVQIKEFLLMQQESIKHLVETSKTDLETVNAILGSANEMLKATKK